MHPVFKNIFFYFHFNSRKFKKIIWPPLIEFMYIFLGSTAAIFLARFVIWVNHNFNSSVTWPGIEIFFDNGSILLISFSFLATAAFVTTRGLKINFLNVITFLSIVANAAVYSAYLSNTSLIATHFEKNEFLWWYSIAAFWGAAIWLLLILIIDQTKSVDMTEIRRYSLEVLEKKFKPSQE